MSNRSKWNPFNYPPQAVLKSVWAFIIPILAILSDTLTSGDPITWRSIIAALISGAVTGYGVFAVTNKPIPGEVTPAEVDRVEAGYARVGSLFQIVGAILLVLALLALIGLLSFSIEVILILAIVGLVLLVVAWSR